ncbi:uncharacterized protein [Diadema setosum]|uniref:uncharacterized protein n=1 Tax=Diadema setosum TaxID=31175 RepID=UPI003B3BA464
MATKLKIVYSAILYLLLCFLAPPTTGNNSNASSSHCQFTNTSMGVKLFANNPLLENLHLSTNRFEAIPHEALSALSSLPVVDLVINYISSLNFSGFERWQDIKRIDLMLNNIGIVRQNDFLPLQNTTVRLLDLANNKIQDLPDQAFLHLETVNDLILSGNAISTFDIRPFLGMVSVNYLQVYGSHVQNLFPSDTSSNISIPYPIIEHLDLQENMIQSVPNGALWGFQTTKTLNLWSNRISSIRNDSFCCLISLTDLDISRNQLSFIPQGAFSCLANLERLNISGNLLQVLSPDSFHGMLSIQIISLSHNLVTDLSRAAWTTTTLHTLDIANNLLDSSKKDRFNGLSNLQALNISFNKINYLSVYSFAALSNLLHLDIRNEKHIVLNGFLKLLPKLQFLDMSNTFISWQSIRQFSNNTNLLELRMEQAQLRGHDLFDRSQNISLFANLVSLQTLRLKGNYLFGMDALVFSNLSKLYFLDLSDSRISVLQSGTFKDLRSLAFLYMNNNKVLALDGEVFQGLGNLRVLLIENNIISKLAPTTFATTQNLDQLILSENSIGTIHPGTSFPMNPSLTLDISRNPFSCTCELKWFRNWLHNTDIKVKHPNQTLCSSASLPGLTNKPILSFQPSDYCGVDIGLVSGLIMAGVAAILLGVLAYINRWWLNYKFFLLKLAFFGYKEVEEDLAEDDHDYQLNLMFHDSEEELVLNTIRPALEERLPHLQHVLYGDDDLNARMYYIDAIHDAIERSFKTVLLVSNQSVGDAWFMTKIRIALEHLNETRLDKVILIFVEDIAADNLPYLVRLFLSRNRPYILWTDDEDGQKLFWATFEKSMRTNRVLNNTIPV